MGLMVKQQRDGTLRPHWYGVYTEGGERKVVNLDVALEALKECIRKRKATPADLWKYAKVCRVANVMRPYLEAIE